jgi:hypothetical protein
MRNHTIVLAMLAALLILPGASAQTPVSRPTSGVLLQATLDQVAPDNLATIGITRTSFEPGGTLRVSAGSGPAIFWVEAGEITLTPDAGSPQLLIVRAGAAQEPVEGGEHVIAAGDGFVLAAGTSVELRNDSTATAMVLDLLSASDTLREAGDGVDQAVVMSTEATLPDAPVLVTFSLVTLDPGGHLTLPQEPAVSIYAAVDKAKVFHVTGNGFNRFSEPVAVYVLTVAPA